MLVDLLEDGLEGAGELAFTEPSKCWHPTVLIRDSHPYFAFFFQALW